VFGKKDNTNAIELSDIAAGIGGFRWSWLNLRLNRSFIWSGREAEKFTKPWHLQMPLKIEHF
jgi:hypothetical protein